MLREVTFKDVADEVEASVQDLDLDDLHARAGGHEDGYVEPTQAAWDILEETMEPFLDDIKRHMELGLEYEAIEICQGVVLGLYRIEQGKNGKIVEWAPDFPGEAAGSAIEALRTGGKGRIGRSRIRGRQKGPRFPPEFMDQFDAGWRDMIVKILSPKRRT